MSHGLQAPVGRPATLNSFGLASLAASARRDGHSPEHTAQAEPATPRASQGMPARYRRSATRSPAGASTLTRTMATRIYRSNEDRKIAGVLGGLGEHLDIDPNILRIAFVVATLFSVGLGVVVYFVSALVLPRAPQLPPGESYRALPERRS